MRIGYLVPEEQNKQDGKDAADGDWQQSEQTIPECFFLAEPIDCPKQFVIDIDDDADRSYADAGQDAGT